MNEHDEYADDNDGAVQGDPDMAEQVPADEPSLDTDRFPDDYRIEDSNAQS